MYVSWPSHFNNNLYLSLSFLTLNVVVVIIIKMAPKLFLSLLSFSLLTLSVAARPYVLVLSQEDFKDEVPADSDSSSAEWDEFGDSDSHKSEEDLDPGSWRQIFEPSSTDPQPQPQSDTEALYYSAVTKLMTGDARIIEEGSGEIETAAESGHPAAQSVLGFLWGIGLFRERNKQKAFVYHHFASEGGNMQSKMALAYLYTRQDVSFILFFPILN